VALPDVATSIIAIAVAILGSPSSMLYPRLGKKERP
jgi:hypothetical protein